MKAVVLRDSEPLIRLSQKFVKGEKPQITDRRWGPSYNEKVWRLTREGYNEPHDKEVIGFWMFGKTLHEIRATSV